MFKKANISCFPLGVNVYDRYDIVYLGDIIHGHKESLIPKAINNEYVFLFTTTLNKDRESCSYGHVKIDFIRDELLSYFNRHIRDRGHRHVLGEENLKLNDFIEIIYEETPQGKQISAHLKNQSITKNDFDIWDITEFSVILAKENDFDNLPSLELGPEFEAQLKLDKANEYLNDLDTNVRIMRGIAYRNQENTEDIESIKKAQDILEKEREEARQKRDQLFNDYLEIRKNRLYIHRSLR